MQLGFLCLEWLGSGVSANESSMQHVGGALHESNSNYGMGLGPSQRKEKELTGVGLEPTISGFVGPRLIQFGHPAARASRPPHPCSYHPRSRSHLLCLRSGLFRDTIDYTRRTTAVFMPSSYMLRFSARRLPRQREPMRWPR